MPRCLLLVRSVDGMSAFTEPVKCKNPGNPEHGHSYGDNYSVGSEVTFSCEEGFQLIGATRVTCLQSGGWSHLIPYCEGIVLERYCVFTERKFNSWC